MTPRKRRTTAGGNGTTTLFAARDVLDGKVVGRSMQPYRHRASIRFLEAVEDDASPEPEALRLKSTPKVIIVVAKDGHQTSATIR